MGVKKIKKNWISKDFIEELADLEHKQWCHWANYLFDLPDRDLKFNIQRWKGQTKTKYKDLSEKEKELDRKWARKVSKIIKAKIERLEKMYKSLSNFKQAGFNIIQERTIDGCIKAIKKELKEFREKNKYSKNLKGYYQNTPACYEDIGYCQAIECLKELKKEVKNGVHN